MTGAGEAAGVPEGCFGVNDDGAEEARKEATGAQDMEVGEEVAHDGGLNEGEEQPQGAQDADGGGSDADMAGGVTGAAGDDGMDENDDNDDASQFQQFSSQCLRSFKVENHGNTSKVIELRITPRSAKLNFKCPVSTIPCQVFSNSSTAVIHLTKLDPTIDDWGDFDWSFIVRDKQASTYVSITNTTNNYQAITNDASPPSTGGAAATWYDNAGDATYSAAEKACPQCTFLNPATASSCGICLANL